MRKINRIIVHCTATPAGRDVAVAEIDLWHRQRGFKGIGYHYVVDLGGVVHAGRSVEEIGAHCRGYNRGSIGVAYVGGLSADGKMPADTRTDAQKVALRAFVNELKRIYPDATVHPHSEFAAKACHCFDPVHDL